MIYLAMIVLGLTGAYGGFWIAHEWYKLKDSGWD
jgi:hypothetical protein